MNHLVLYLENGREIYIGTNEYTDSMLCNIGGQAMGKLWDATDGGSRVKVARTFITKQRKPIAPQPVEEGCDEISG